jgi:hypothetical protein
MLNNMNNNATICEWLHSYLDTLTLFKYPFDLAQLPKSGIYFFHEQGEAESHRPGKPRIVRVGTHRKNNFRSRIAEHFVLNERKMEFTQYQPAPHERSIFRKHIGRALLSKSQDPYLSIWDIDFTTREAREANGHRRDIPKA